MRKMLTLWVLLLPLTIGALNAGVPFICNDAPKNAVNPPEDTSKTYLGRDFPAINNQAYNVIYDNIGDNCNLVMPNSHPDFDALMALYNATNGPNWNDNTGWADGAAGTNFDVCSWFGVRCNNAGRVSLLSLTFNNLNGTLPPEIGNLSALNFVNFENNHLSGNIPSAIGNLANLTTLDLQANQLTGGIPPELGNLPNMSILSLSANQLTGSIPTQLGNLSNLTYLLISHNQLSGTIPVELGNLSNLTYMRLSNNQLTGNIPTELGNLTNLTNLDISTNPLGGNIPSSLGNLTNLEYLAMYNNQLVGSIPASLGNMSSLISLVLSHNFLSGSIPASFGNLSSLQELVLVDNELSGTIPPSLGNLNDLGILTLSLNQLTGGIPASLGNLSTLHTLSLSANQLTGDIPPALGNLSNLANLDLSNNQLTGSIPSSFGSLSMLGDINLSGNNLSGCFAPNLSNLCIVAYDFSNNPGLHLNGDFAAFCNNGAGGCGVDADGDTYSFPDDCDDTSPDLHPGATELCNGIDDDCDGNTDEGAEAPAQINGTLSFCGTGNTVLTASGGSIFNWSTGATTASITVSTAGTYTVTVDNGNGCPGTATATVAQLALPTPSISGNLSFCAGGSTLLTASGGNTYGWSTGATTTAIVVNTAGTYTVTATGANGCTATATATSTQLALPTPSISGNLSFCAGGSTTLTASGSNIYAWSTGATTAAATVNMASTYTVTATGANGCTATATATATQLAPPTPNISGNLSFCAGGSTTLTASGGNIYAWSTGATTTAVTVNAAGNYTVTATGANGCTATATATVTFNTPSAQITGNTAICTGGTATLTATGGSSYTWSTGANTPSINTNIAGIYTVTATAASGCTATATATVTINNIPLVVSVLGNLAFCEGSNTILTSSAVGTSYAWSTGASTAFITVNTGGTFTVTVTNAYFSGCSATATANVVVKPLPALSITASPDNCAGLSTVLTASGGTSYIWFSGATTNTISTFGPGTYTVTATNASNCTATASIALQARPSLTCPNQVVCAGTSTTLSNAPTGGIYSGAGISGNNFDAVVAGTGTHIVTYTATSAGGCTAVCVFTVTVPPSIDANITTASRVAPNSTGNYAAVSSGSFSATYNWSITNGSITSGINSRGITYTAGPSGNVSLSVNVSDGGCTATSNRSVSIGNGPSMTCTAGQAYGINFNACSINQDLTHPFISGPNPPLTLSVAFGNGSPTPLSLPTGGAVTPSGINNYTFQTGQTQVVYTAMNGLGQTTTCTRNITVRDIQLPSLSCPLNIVRSTAPDQCTAAVSYTAPTASDNCGIAGSSLLRGLPSGAAFPIGTTVVVWKANDIAGNLISCSFSVTVQDNQLPNISCPPNQNLPTHPGRCEAYTLYNAPVASDNCGVPALTRISGLESGGPFPKGLNTIVWQARDAAGNTRTCSFRVIVSDNEAPAIFCPADVSVNTAFGTCAAMVTYPMATFTDNCPGGTIARIGGLPSGSSFPVGVTPVSFRATDAGGRSSTCTLRVTVTDNQPPSMACPGNIVVTGSGTPCNAQAFYGTPSATDNCFGALTPFLFTGLGSGSSFPAGVTTNVWRAIDGNGLSTDCTFTVTVNCTNIAPRPNGQTARETLAQQQPTLHLAPNPATSSALLTAEGLGEQGGDILVFDAMGRLVFQHPVLPADATIRLDFGAAALATGAYRVVLKTEKAVVGKTLVVANRVY